MSDPKAIDIPLSLLKLSKDNPRFEGQQSQRSILKKMLEDLGNEIYELARNICERGLSPIDKILVSKSDRFFVVREGNRRTTALKLLNNPELLDNMDIETSLSRKFKALQPPKIDKISVIECNDEEQCRWMMELRHQGQQNGIGTIEWSSLAKQRHGLGTEKKSSTTQQELALELFEKIKGEVSKDLSLEKFKITNFHRILGDPKVRKILGITMEGGCLHFTHKSEKVIGGIKFLIEEIATGRLKVADIYHASDRETYFNEKFPEELKPSDSDELKSPELIIGSDPVDEKEKKPSSPAPKKKKPRVKHKLFNKKDLECNAESPKVIRLYKELESLKVTENPNACALIIRCLLEVAAKDKLRRTGHAEKVQDGLSSALSYIANLKNGVVTERELSKTISSLRSNNFLGLMDLNDWAHSVDVFASETDTRDFWDKYYTVLKFLLS